MQEPLFGGRYRLEETLGRGGMGVVYRAVDQRTGGTVAVKVLADVRATNPVYLERLRREARITASLTSPRVVRVIDLGEQDGAPFLVLEYVAGPTLGQHLRARGALPPAKAVAICLEVALAMEAAHTRGIVHRDLKPENIKLVDGQVKVLDFGIARSDEEMGVTLTGAYLGTPRYSAPERITSSGDIRSDIYAVGAILFELLTGKPPFDGPTGVAILTQHATAPPPELPPGVPRPVRAIVSRCLAKSPDDRYQTPAELAAALAAGQRAITGPGGSVPTVPESSAALSRGGTTPPRDPTESFVTARFGTPPLELAATQTQHVAAPTAAPPPELSVVSHRRWGPIVVAATGVLLAAAAGGAVLLSRDGDTDSSASTPATSNAPAATAVIPRQALSAAPAAATTSATTPGPARVTTLVGTGEGGVVDGPGASARLTAPVGIAVDRGGGLFVVDEGRIRRISPTGEVVTLAGAAEPGFVDGPAAVARFNNPRGVAVDSSGTLYIADTDNHRVRTLSPDGTVRTLAGTGIPGMTDGPAGRAQFNLPIDVAVDRSGVVYVADSLNDRIRRIARDGTVTTLAGGGTGNALDGVRDRARFSFPSGIAVDGSGVVYIADTYSARIRAISLQGEVRTVAGSGEDGDSDGPAATARFSDPLAVAVDSSGNVYVLDTRNRVRLVSRDGAVATLAGSGMQGFADSVGREAQFDRPQGLAVCGDGRLYVADTENHRIRVLSAVP